MVILLDMDDVLEDLVTPWCETLSERYGLNVKKEDVVDWDIASFFPSLSEKEVFAPLGDEEFWKRTKPLPYAQEGVSELIRRGHELFVVTSSHYGTIDAKMRCVMRRLFPQFTAENLILSRRKQMIRGDVLIDDNPANLTGGRYEKILMDAPYNRSVDDERLGFRRVRNWKEILAEIGKIEFERIAESVLDFSE